MRSNKINYLMVGSFLLLILISLVVSIALLTGRTGATDKYHAVYDNVAGLKYGTLVLYEGYRVGQVEKIEPQEKDGRIRFRVDLSVIKGWRIPADSVAQISASGLLAAMTISIHAGTSTEKLQPGQPINSQEATNVFASFSSVADQISDLSENSIKPLLETLGKSVGGIGNIVENDGQLFVRRLRELVDMLTERTPEITANLTAFSSKLNEGGDRFNKLLSDTNAKSLSKTIDNVESISTHLVDLSGDLQNTRKEFDQILASIQLLVDHNRPALDQSTGNLNHVMESLAEHIDTINHNLDNTSRNLFEFSRQIRGNPGLLLGGRPPKDEANEKP